MTKNQAKYRVTEKLSALELDESLLMKVKAVLIQYAVKKLKPEKAFSVRPRQGGFLVYRLK